MYGSGPAAYDLDAFDKSEAMADLRSELSKAANEGAFSLEIPYANVGDGSTRQGIMAVTLLRMHGYETTFEAEGIKVAW